MKDEMCATFEFLKRPVIQIIPYLLCSRPVHAHQSLFPPFCQVKVLHVYRGETKEQLSNDSNGHGQVGGKIY